MNISTEELTPAAAEHRQIALDRAAGLVLDAVNAAGHAANAAKSGDAEKAESEARRAATIGMDAMNTLTGKPIGAKNPLFARQSTNASHFRQKPVRAPKQDPFDLGALATLDTPDARQLLALLGEAQAVAERVDASRGKALSPSVPLQPGESRGTDLAEAISLLTLHLRREIHGASGGGRE